MMLCLKMRKPQQMRRLGRLKIRMMTRIRMKKRTSSAQHTIKLPVIVKMVECGGAFAATVHCVKSACNDVLHCSYI